uniref:Uncharacterized protein n=1 Tax=Anopheles epiroticus TaxID=199890 RepID=A0A182PWV0_9DIPT
MGRITALYPGKDGVLYAIYTDQPTVAYRVELSFNWEAPSSSRTVPSKC